GTVSISGDTVTYTPDTDFAGDDSFTYTIEEPDGTEATGTITVTVTHPMASPFSVYTAENTAVNIDAAAAAFDPAGQTLTVVAKTNGSHGTVAIQLDGTVTYTPNTNYTGDDSFTYTIEDEDGNEATGTITVSIADPTPVALGLDTSTDVNT